MAFLLYMMKQHRKLEEDTFVVFDVETTGLSAVYDTIIELGGSQSEEW